MAEGRKVADEMKKEQGENAKRMKIGGVETDVTLKNGINQGRGFTKIKEPVTNRVSNGLPYLPFPISALPKEAVEQIMPWQRGKCQKTTVVEKAESNECVTFDIDGYKKYNYAKLPTGGLDTLKLNFSQSFFSTVTMGVSYEPSNYPHD